jgi:hypothetical protein
MPAEVSFNSFLSVNGVDLSNRLREVRYSAQTDPIDATASGDLAHVMLSGLTNASLTARFIQDYAAGSVHQTLNPLVGSAGFTVIYRKSSAVASPTNPSITFTAVLEGYNPFGGSQGQLMENSVTFRAAGAVVRAEA